MFLEHASYIYPSHLVPLLDLALTLFVLLLLLPTLRSRDLPFGRMLGPKLDRLWAAARRRTASTPALMAGVFLLGVLASVAVELVLGPPRPHVVDEISYLHAAETFARGELTRPVHPHQAHFETEHILQRPTVQSKYPPAQGLFLSLGVLIGHPPAALWLLTGLLGAVVVWFLGPWLPPPWPLVGGLAVLLRVGLGSYWNQSYWGGSLAAIGAALLLGGMHRAIARPTPGRSLILGLGVLLLANTRPFEGFLFALPSAVVLLAWLLGCSPERRGFENPPPVARRLARVGLPVILLLSAGAAAMAIYHHAVTGDPLLFPHALYTEQFMPGVRHFLYPPAEPGAPWLGRALKLGIMRLAIDVQFQVGLLGGLLGLLAVPQLRDRNRSPWLWLAAVSGAMVVAGHFFTKPWHTHYAALLLPVLALFMTSGLRRATVLLRRCGRAGRLLPVAFLAVQLVVCLVHLPAHRADDGHRSRQRQTVEHFLAGQPEDDLIFLERTPLLFDEWVWNPADPDTAAVIWARSLTPAEDRALESYYAEQGEGRRVWHLEIWSDGVVLRRGSPDGEVALSTRSGQS